MPEILEIQGDEVVVRRTEVLRKMKLAQLMPHLVQRAPVTLPNLPRTAVFAHYDESQPNKKIVYFLSEIAPGIKTITKENKLSGHNKRRYRLAMPWTYFWFVAVQEGTRTNFTITDYRCFHSRKQYKDVATSEFFVAFCPNIYKDNGTICFGSTGAPVDTVDKQIDYIVNTWYTTEFNDHLDRSDMMWPFGGNSFKNWVERTSSDGTNAWLDFPEWNSTRKKFTIADLLGAGVARTDKMTSDVSIPEIPVPMTFGRAEEWLKSISPVNRGRLKIALGNMLAEDDDAIEMSVEPLEVTDDGGIPV